MNFDILTLFPDFFSGPFSESIIKNAIDSQRITIEIHDIRRFSTDKHKKVDDYAFGGKAGMVMQIQPIDHAITHLKRTKNYDEIIYVTPDGAPYNQKMANHLSTKKNILILCGRYKGVDQRVRDHYITKEISIGDYVLTGGELPAAILVDSITRLIPGVIGDEQSALYDSFQDGLLAPPVYSRPSVYKGIKVPEVLLSGNQKKIDQWLEAKSEELTALKRPDLKD